MHQADVQQTACQRDAGMVQEIRLELQVIPVLFDGGILQDGLEVGGGAAGDPARVSGSDSHAADGGKDSLSVRFHDQCHVSRPHGSLQHLGNGARFERQFRLFRGRRGGRSDVGDVFPQGIEFIFLKQIRDPGAVGPGQPHPVQVGFHRNIGLDGHQFMAQGDVVPGLGEHRLLARAELFQMGVDILHGPIFRDELGSTDFSDALDARNVVGRIAAEGQHLDDLGRIGDSVFPADGGLVDHFVLAPAFSGFDLKDMVCNQLTVILVRGHHVDIRSLGAVSAGDRTDDIVGLVAALHQDRDVQRLAELRQRFQRIDDQLGRLAPVGLVGRVHFVAEGSARRVEGHGQVGGLFPLNQFEEVFGESEQDGHVHSLGIDHRTARERVVHLEYQRMAVDEVEFVRHHSSKVKKNLQIHAKSLPLQSISQKTIIIKTTYNEKNIPTFPPQACQQARFPRAYGFRQRSPRAGFPPPSWPQEADRFFRRPVLGTVPEEGE